MKILHTADWHLADRLKQIDRTKDLERAVERIAFYCEQHVADVLLIAGDLFSELARPEALQASLAHLSRTFRPFLLRGGTVVAIAGNHDNDIYCNTLRRAFQLAAPNAARLGDSLPTGRFYLINRPSHFRLLDPLGMPVQFACMPYPTLSRYAGSGPLHSYSDFAERCQALRSAFITQLQTIRQQTVPQLPSILTAHVNTLTPRIRALDNHRTDDDIVIDDRVVTDDWDYVALGHLHAPGKVRNLPHVRYSGSIERLSMAEKDQSKGVFLVSIREPGPPPQIRFLPLEPTTFYDVCIDQPQRDLPTLRARYPNAATALVRCHIQFDPRTDNLHEVLAEVAKIFPRCYERTWSDKQSDTSWLPPPQSKPTTQVTQTNAPAEHNTNDGRQNESVQYYSAASSLRQLVLRYLEHQLANDTDRSNIVSLVKKLLEDSA